MTAISPPSFLSPISAHQPDGTRGVAAQLRQASDRGVTRPVAWRRAQLRALLHRGCGV